MIDIKDKSNCCGCYACANACPQKCIEMKNDEEGFFYPKINKKECIDCGLCEKVCPIVNQCSDIELEDTLGFAYFNQSDDIRQRSTSGGAFFEIAKQVLDSGGVVYGAAFDSDFAVSHIRVDSIQNVDKLLGSKYVQSKMDGIYTAVKKDLLDERMVLFSGTPCQVEALNFFLRKKYDKLILLDVICHGVPSEEVWLKYLKQRKRNYNSDIQAISFRDKENGWKNYNIKIKFKNRKEYKSIFFEDPYLRCFIKDIILRPSCYSCRFKSVNRVSDITLGDYWGIWELNSAMFDDKGTSFIMGHSQKGLRLIKSTLPSATECDIDSAIKYNPSAIKAVEKPQGRDNFFRDLDSTNIINVLEKYSGITNKMKIKRIIKRIIGRK